MDEPYIGPALTTLHANQLVMLKLLRQIAQGVTAMAVDFSKLTAEVAANTSAEQAAVALLQKLTALIAAIPPSNDPATQAQLDSLTAALAANDAALAAAVVANTPAAPAPAPSPTGATGS